MNFNTLVTKAVDVDFSPTESTTVIIPTWIIIGVGIFILIISSVMGIIFEEFVLGFGVFVIGSMLAIMIFVFTGVTSSNNTPEENGKTLQSWVQDEYLIDITIDQADYLIKNQIDISNVPDLGDSEPDRTIFIENAYGKVVGLTLVKKNEGWILFQQEGNEMNTSIEGK